MVYKEHEFFFSSVFIFGNAYLLLARMFISTMKEIYKNIFHPLIKINSLEKKNIYKKFFWDIFEHAQSFGFLRLNTEFSFI
jgi:hypothetical protein